MQPPHPNQQVIGMSNRQTPLPGCLTDLVAFLERLNHRAPLEELGRLLGDLDVCSDQLRDYCIFDQFTYRRNLISQSGWYELLCICWKSGQRSPIHNHAGSTCGLRIIEGIATETSFEPTPCGQIKATGSADYASGYVCTAQDADIHQVSNLQEEGRSLITLHIYSPPLQAMDTFSLMGPESVPYSPSNPGIGTAGDG